MILGSCAAGVVAGVALTVSYFGYEQSARKEESPIQAQAPVDTKASACDTLKVVAGSDATKNAALAVLCDANAPSICVDADKDGVCAGELDCDDHNAAVNVTKKEVCGGVDENCDGRKYEGTRYYMDEDGDKYFDGSGETTLCEGSGEYKLSEDEMLGSDCDPTNAKYNRGSLLEFPTMGADVIADANCDGVEYNGFTESDQARYRSSIVGATNLTTVGNAVINGVVAHFHTIIGYQFSDWGQYSTKENLAKLSPYFRVNACNVLEKGGAPAQFLGEFLDVNADATAMQLAQLLKPEAEKESRDKFILDLESGLKLFQPGNLEEAKRKIAGNAQFAVDNQVVSFVVRRIEIDECSPEIVRDRLVDFYKTFMEASDEATNDALLATIVPGSKPNAEGSGAK